MPQKCLIVLESLMVSISYGLGFILQHAENRDAFEHLAQPAFVRRVPSVMPARGGNSLWRQ